MSFKDIKSQKAAVDIVRRAVRTGKVAHAYLFSGLPGVGKLMTAKTLAMTLNCEIRSDDACGECLSCRKTIRGTHPDIIEIGFQENKKRISIDTIRELERRLTARPNEGRAKVAIIDPADAMTAQAANALLKTLEEPRSDAFILVITSRPSSLLATVRSRCQHIRFKPLPKATIEDLLKLKGASAEEATVAAALSSGSMEQAQAYIQQDLSERMSSALKVLEAVLEPTPLKGLDIAVSMAGKRDDAVDLLDLMMATLHELLWQKNHSSHVDDWLLLKKFGDGLIESTKILDIERMTRFIFEIEKAKTRISENNMNPQLALEGMIISMRGRADGTLESHSVVNDRR